MKTWLSTAATWISDKAGSAWALLGAFLVVLVWAILGPVLHFSGAWQLTINTGTTIVTFIMVFALQHSQNRDTLEIKAMLREMVRDISEVDEAAVQEEIAREEP